MNEDENLIATLEFHADHGGVPASMIKQAAQRLRELLTPDDNKGSVPAVINAPPCDAARELMKLLAPFSTAKKEDEGVDLITSALTAHGEAVRERCAKVASKWMTADQIQHGDGSAPAEIRALNLTEAL